MARGGGDSAAHSSLADSRDLTALYAEPSVYSQVEAVYNAQADQVPGPGVFNQESAGFCALGRQAFSQHRTEPSMPFPRTGWDNWRKVLITKAHKEQPGLDAPGPKYLGEEELSTLGKKGIGLSKAKRFNKKNDVSVGPGPQGYDVSGMHAKDVLTYDLKGIKFSKGSRFEQERASAIRTGPGQYTIPTTLVNDPKKGRSFGVGFEAYDKVIRPGWENEGKGTFGSGPGEPLWEVWDSKEKIANAPKIPKAERFPPPRRSQSVPGPGQYKRSERDIANCKSWVSDTKSAKGVKFGKPSKHPRLKQRLLLQCTNAGWGVF